MANNRELSQLASFLVVNDTTGNVGLATTASPYVGIGTANPITKFHVVGDSTFSGNVSIGGTLIYEDVTNIDSVGLVTARNGVRISGGGLEVVGVSTFNQQVQFKSTIQDIYGNVGTASSVLISTGIGVSWVPISVAALQGSQGIQGATGSSGSNGAQGVQGASGSSGSNGAQGIQGATGTIGAQGSQGIQGATGTIGAQGIQGATGTGAQGSQGVQGATGTGTQGSQGIQGSQGPQGPSGGGGGGGESYWASTAVGINTLSNVGIGTTNPTSKLTVSGNVLVTGIVTATSFVGDGSGLTGIIAAGSGVVVQDNGTTVGTAATINFGTNLTASFSSGTATITAAGGGGNLVSFPTGDYGLLSDVTQDAFGISLIGVFDCLTQPSGLSFIDLEQIIPQYDYGLL